MSETAETLNDRRQDGTVFTYINDDYQTNELTYHFTYHTFTCFANLSMCC